MSKVYTVYDKNKISKITFKFPNLMSSDSEESIKRMYQDILETKNLLHEARHAVRCFEEDLKIKESKFSELLNIVDIEFESKEIEGSTNKSNIMIKNYGNDFIGRSTY